MRPVCYPFWKNVLLMPFVFAKRAENQWKGFFGKFRKDGPTIFVINLEHNSFIFMAPSGTQLNLYTILHRLAICHFNTINRKVGLTQKKRCQNAAIFLGILMKNGIDPSNFFHFSVWPLKIFEVKGGQYAKKLEFGQTKIILLY